jgi:hypothetical protein
MAYIPTIHTFQDDINENRRADELPISGATESIVNDDQILRPETKIKSGTKILLISISIFFILASAAAVGYYFYNQNQITKQQEILKAQALENARLEKEKAGTLENVKNILPNLSLNTKINTLMESGNFLNNVVTIKIAKSQNGDSLYPEFYALIIANEKDFNKDLIFTFKLKDVTQNIEIPVTTILTTTATTSTTTIENKKKVTKIIEIVSTTSTTTLISTSTTIRLNDLNNII